ncbi:MAG: sigma-70 family RNA polymerase sigma factor [Bacteroidales bacterium]|nr:sigma-70 family RNA polymerase sigma factor [Bacteroidales bacterium]
MAEATQEIHKQLIEESKQGNKTSQYRLYSLYAKGMYSVALRLMRTREEAEDMLQESFIDAFKKLRSFRYESSFGSWLKRIVINHCLNEIKRKKTDLQFFDDMGYFEQQEAPEESYEAGLSVDNIKKAMEHLPQGSRMIFSLYLLEGYDHREIAQILSISESNSKSQYMRARLKVKSILSEISNETER